MMNRRQRYEAAVARTLAGKERAKRNNNDESENTTMENSSEEQTGHPTTRHRTRMADESINQQLLVDAVDEQQIVSGLMREKR